LKADDERYQVFSPEDLNRMGKVFRACAALPETLSEKEKDLLAKAIVITYRPRASEAALRAAAVHLVGLKYLN
jgi:hypothetical protein